MSRNKAFSSGRPEPFSEHEGISLEHETIRGAFKFFNPTQARFRLDEFAKKQAQPKLADGQLPKGRQVVAPEVKLQWRSRNNRKGRHALYVDKSHPASTATSKAVLRGISRMFLEFPYWDVSYLIAVSFAIGSLLFILSGLFYWLPLVAPSSEFPNETTVGGGVTAFVGAMLFEFGAILLIFEAYNENQTGCFGWALHHALSGEGATNDDTEGGLVIAKVSPGQCQHHHGRKGRKSRKGRPEEPLPKQEWRWYPSWNEVKTHYIHEIGFLANMTLSIGATLFCVTGICSLPGVYSNLSQGAAWGTYWLAYLIGGILFAIASFMYMIETQSAWYKPAPHLLGWHIGLWNMIGSIGWTLDASFGYCTASWCAYESDLTLIWASFAFFVGSMLLWYEALEKYPIDRK